MAKKVNRREAAALINSISAGVVPRIGLRHIAVGRLKEVEAYLNDLETIEDGGAAFRFIDGRFGSGKSFLIQLIRNNAMDRNFVVMDADLSPERRFTGTKGQGLKTFQELMQNISNRTNPDGHALDSILQKWINSVQQEIILTKGLTMDDPKLIEEVNKKIFETLSDLTEYNFGFSFSRVLSLYWEAIKTENEALKHNTLKWLRGEYQTKTEAKKDLGVDLIINDQNWYEFLKLLAVFIHMVGYKGLLVFIDEGVNLYKIVNRQARNNNYEKILTMFNDMMQGKAHYIGMTIAGTPEFISDERRGLFSYEALRSRLGQSRLFSEGFTDYSAPILKLERLSSEELLVLLERLTDIHKQYNKSELELTSDQIKQFLSILQRRIGSNELLTTREVSREFISLLNLLTQNPDTTFEKETEKFEISAKKKPTFDFDFNEEDLFEDFEI